MERIDTASLCSSIAWQWGIPTALADGNGRRVELGRWQPYPDLVGVAETHDVQTTQFSRKGLIVHFALLFADIAPTVPGLGVTVPRANSIIMAGLALSAAMVTFGYLLTRGRSQTARWGVILSGMAILLVGTSFAAWWSSSTYQSRRGRGAPPILPPAAQQPAPVAPAADATPAASASDQNS